jgi:hypothetical protein
MSIFLNFGEILPLANQKFQVPVIHNKIILFFLNCEKGVQMSQDLEGKVRLKLPYFDNRFPAGCQNIVQFLKFFYFPVLHVIKFG